MTSRFDSLIVPAIPSLTRRSQAAHRDVLGAFSHCIVGCTPAAYMEEIFLALPSLWKLIDTHGDREYTSSEVWEILYDSLIGASMFIFAVKPTYTQIRCRLFALPSLPHHRLRSHHRHYRIHRVQAEDRRGPEGAVRYRAGLEEASSDQVRVRNGAGQGAQADEACGDGHSRATWCIGGVCLPSR